MRSVPIVVVTYFVIVSVSEFVTAQVAIGAGGEGAYQLDGCPHEAVLYVPTDHRPGRRLPLIFFLHGAGGKPTTWPWRSATGGKGYLICGLPYGAQEDAGQGGVRSDMKTREAMVEFIERARAQIDAEYGIDREQVLLTGLSMGGWGVNYFGFIASARDRYAAYAILAAGPLVESGVDLTVAAGRPTLVLNGATDGNLGVATSGKPALEEAGALVDLVVIPGQGHVPSTESMNEPLAKWLGRVRDQVERTRPAKAIDWIPVHLGDREPSTKGPEALLACIESLPAVDAARQGRPLLVFMTSSDRDRRGKPTKSAVKSAAITEDAFCYPNGLELALAARSFACVRIDLDGRAKKEHPLLHEEMAPAAIVKGALLQNDAPDAPTTCVHLDANKLKATGLALLMRSMLSLAANEVLHDRLMELVPTAKELEALEKKREKLVNDFDRQRSADAPAATKIRQLDAELTSLVARRKELVAELSR